jgi:prevent-host-death family protein
MNQPEGAMMTGITATEARSNLYRLIDETAESHQPVLITGKRNRAVLVSEDDWAAIQETLFLLSVPGMRESIREGMDTAIGECDEELDW